LRKYFDAPPLVKAPSLSISGAEVYLKIETGLPTGSFKPRGALYALATNLKRRKIEEVTASSTGNHGAAVAYAAKTLGARATIFVPMGDTALMRGVAAAVKQLAPQVKIVGVQAEQAPAYCLSWRAGEVVATESCDTCADGLATRTPDAGNVAAIRKLVDDVAL